MALILAWIVGFLFPPLAILLLPNECERDKVGDFLVALVLSLLLIVLGWLYVFPKISACETIVQSHQVAAQPVIPQATPTAQTVGAAAGTNGKVIVVNVKG